MNKDSVKVTSLQINSIPGLRKGLDKNLYADLNANLILILGPNASGKSSTVRALRNSLWESSGKRYNLDVEFTINDDKWRVLQNFGSQEIYKNGEKTIELLPGNEFADRYNLSFRDFFTTDEKELASQVQNEIFGGLNLQDIVNSRKYSDKINQASGKIYNGLNDAIENLRKLQDEQNKLRGEAENLKNKEQKAAEYDRKIAEIQCLNAAIKVLEQKEKVESLNEELMKYDPLLKELLNFSSDRVLDLEKSEEEKRSSIREHEHKISTLNAEIKELRFNHNQLTVSDVDTLEGLKDSISDLYNEVQAQYENQDAYLRTLEDLSAQFGYRKEVPVTEWKNYGLLEAFNLADADNLDKLLFPVQSNYLALIEAERQERSILDNLDENVGNLNPADLNRGLNALSDWLKEQRDKNSLNPATFFIFIAAILIALFFLYPSVNGDNIIYILVGIALASVLVWLVNKMLNSGGKNRIQDYKNTGLGNIDEWTAENVINRIDGILENIQQLKANEKLEESLKIVQREIREHRDKLDKYESTLRQYKSNIEQALYLNADSIGTSVLTSYIDRINKWKLANSNFKLASGRLKLKKAELNEKLTEFNEIIGKIGFTPCKSTENVRATNKHISEQYRFSIDLHKELAATERALEINRKEWEDTNTRIIQAYADIGKSPADREEVFRLSDQIDSYRQNYDKLQGEQAVLDSSKLNYEEARASIGSSEDFLSLSEEILKDRIEASMLAQKSYGEIKREIGATENAVNETMLNDRLAQAILERDEAEEAMEQMFLDNLSKFTGKIILDKIQSLDIKAHQPRILQRANYILSNVTKGKYQIVMSRESKTPEFMGHDIERDLKIPLDELSSGTRIHLLMALRIASIEEQEIAGRHWKMPLFADESLATSDDDRGEELIETLIEVCQSGRQVFYLTADTNEIETWINHLRKRDYGINYKLIPLDENSRNKVADWEKRDLFSSAPLDLVVDIPAPNSADIVEYKAELKAKDSVFPAFNILHHTIEQQHLVYFIDNAYDLHSLLTKKITTVGQIRTIDKSEYRDLIQKHKIDEKEALLKKYRDLLAIGRPKPVNRSILLENGVTDSKIDEVEELLVKCDYNPEKLMAEIDQVKGIGPGTQEKIRDNLLADGYLTDDESLSPDEIERLLLDFISNMELTAQEANEFLKQ